ncbi:MAG: acyl carrier protein [Ruminococcaceae bacterium]|nr:acyl carrier protein [Oscillospiraceae bacterium]
MEFERIKEIISQQLGVNAESITMETSFTDDLGADSLDLVELVMALEEEFDIEMPDDEIENIKTVSDAVSFLKELL